MLQDDDPLTTQTIAVPRVGRWRGWVPATLCGAGLIFIALVVLWLRQTSTSVYTQGADALTIRAVLRMDVDTQKAEEFSARLRAKLPDAEIEIITEAAGRSLLALQEPWIAEMPDFEVTPLPALIEIKHPELLTNPAAVVTFIEQLRNEPEVDFVAYNETAHGRLSKLAESTSQLQNHTARWLLAALALAGLMAQICFTIITPARSLMGIFLRQTAIWLISWALAVAMFRLWESGAVATGDWVRLGTMSYLGVGLASLFIVLLAEIINAFSAWILRR